MDHSSDAHRLRGQSVDAARGTRSTLCVGWVFERTPDENDRCRQVSGFEWVADSITYGIRPTGLAILEGFLPAVVITLLLILVKHLFKLAYTRFGGLSCYSLAEWYAMIMYSFFLFLNVFLVVAVEGTFFLALVRQLLLKHVIPESDELDRVAVH